ncbi:hypothetical protein ABI_15250 [Asticcacaulis biprosthecium C19]|uniref:Uncharacterized protein n=1 Tax=Asticcacaulis biprosthecium C19 TaxID=715226 RepID=F4QJ22_9CAUL|nr:hypothetical protein ABI_15250 [Asticcacaulis biprosthecium C19]
MDMSLDELEAIEDGEAAATVPELVAIAGAIDVGVFQLVDGL